MPKQVYNLSLLSFSRDGLFLFTSRLHSSEQHVDSCIMTRCKILDHRLTNMRDILTEKRDPSQNADWYCMLRLLSFSQSGFVLFAHLQSPNTSHALRMPESTNLQATCIHQKIDKTFKYSDVSVWWIDSFLAQFYSSKQSWPSLATHKGSANLF